MLEEFPFADTVRGYSTPTGSISFGGRSQILAIPYCLVTLFGWILSSRSARHPEILYEGHLA